MANQLPLSNNLSFSCSLAQANSIRSVPVSPPTEVQSIPAPTVVLNCPPELVGCFQEISTNLQRIADRIDPPESDIVDSGYVAKRLGVSTTHVARMAREGKIPASCIVKGKAEGGLWKFYRKQIDQWIAAR